jgi:hypothetical protein
MALRRLSIVLAFFAFLAPAAHLMELPGKMMLKGPTWLEVQQHLYRGWGPLFGGPIEIAALLVGLALLLRGDSYRIAAVIPVFCYAAMIAVFFLFNNPVNVALSHWTVSTLPKNWMEYRLRWEIGHAISAVLSGVGLICSLKINADEAK